MLEISLSNLLSAEHQPSNRMRESSGEDHRQAADDECRNASQDEGRPLQICRRSQCHSLIDLSDQHHVEVGEPAVGSDHGHAAVVGVGFDTYPAP